MSDLRSEKNDGGGDRVSRLEAEVGELRGDVVELRGGMVRLEAKFDALLQLLAGGSGVNLSALAAAAVQRSATGDSASLADEESKNDIAGLGAMDQGEHSVLDVSTNKEDEPTNAEASSDVDDSVNATPNIEETGVKISVEDFLPPLNSSIASFRRPLDSFDVMQPDPQYHELLAKFGQYDDEVNAGFEREDDESPENDLHYYNMMQAATADSLARLERTYAKSYAPPPLPRHQRNTSNMVRRPLRGYTSFEERMAERDAVDVSSSYRNYQHHQYREQHSARERRSRGGQYHQKTHLQTNNKNNERRTEHVMMQTMPPSYQQAWAEYYASRNNNNNNSYSSKIDKSQDSAREKENKEEISSKSRDERVNYMYRNHPHLHQHNQRKPFSVTEAARSAALSTSLKNNSNNVADVNATRTVEANTSATTTSGTATACVTSSGTAASGTVTRSVTSGSTTFEATCRTATVGTPTPRSITTTTTVPVPGTGFAGVLGGGYSAATSTPTRTDSAAQYGQPHGSRIGSTEPAFGGTAISAAATANLAASSGFGGAAAKATTSSANTGFGGTATAVKATATGFGGGATTVKPAVTGIGCAAITSKPVATGGIASTVATGFGGGDSSTKTASTSLGCGATFAKDTATGFGGTSITAKSAATGLGSSETATKAASTAPGGIAAAKEMSTGFGGSASTTKSTTSGIGSTFATKKPVAPEFGNNLPATKPIATGFGNNLPATKSTTAGFGGSFGGGPARSASVAAGDTTFGSSTSSATFGGAGTTRSHRTATPASAASAAGVDSTTTTGHYGYSRRGNNRRRGGYEQHVGRGGVRPFSSFGESNNQFVRSHAEFGGEERHRRGRSFGASCGFVGDESQQAIPGSSRRGDGRLRSAFGEEQRSSDATARRGYVRHGHGGPSTQKRGA